MSMWIYITPIVVIALIMLIALPIMKKKAAQTGESMNKIQNMKVHLTVAAGHLESINEKPASDLEKSYNVYGLDFDGPLAVEITPNFVHGNTQYSSNTSMYLHFDVTSGNSYEIKVSPKQPKNDSTVINVTPIVNKQIIFKTTFYIIVTDITDTKYAKAMRGIS